ncbi:energy transducer TonB [Aquitalea denitrificans]|uniref:energy transducer TonB n=1 Tax=Aquitalea denitrificans TaxID=519081 RepID=UPI00135B2BC8|nr:energy transducer TonB [Aquitalea denitrificans]
MNLRLQSSSAALPSAAFLGSCSLHVLALLLIAGWLASTPPVILPQLASLPTMTLAAPSAPAAPVVQPSQNKQRAPAKPAVARPAAVPAAKPAARPAARATAPAIKPAAAAVDNTAPTAAAPAAPVAAAPVPAPAVHEPLYRGGYLNNPKPAYPPLSLEMEETGTVRLRVQVSAQGLPVAVELEHSSGFPRLDRAALSAVRGWKFIPAKRGDESIPYTFIVPVEFSLKNLRKP